MMQSTNSFNGKQHRPGDQVFRKGMLAAAFLLLVAAGLPSAWAQALGARARVSAQSVFVGEAFTLQIQLSGTDSPDQPDLSGLDGFEVEYQGGSLNSSTSVTIINGRMTRNVQKGYVLTYQLTPTRAGNLVIPATTIVANGQSTRTQPIAITAQKPMEAENYKLRFSLSKTRAYVGEPIVAEIVFYYSADVDEPKLTAPFFDNDQFHFYELEDDRSTRNAIERLEGKQFKTMRLRRAIVPKRPGMFEIDPVTLSFRGVVGYGMERDLFGRALRQPRFKRFVIPSNKAALEVLDLPTAGRPANFAGHVGEYQISATATPTDVSVGDPITLTVSLSGAPYLDHVELPPLHEQPSLQKNFKIPTERESGKVHGDFKIFTQTIRALSKEITEIPPVELAYFDTEAKAYKIATSKPIPLNVKATNVITAEHAEGPGAPSGPSSEVLAWTQGIAHNYEDIDVLEDQEAGLSHTIRSPAWLASVCFPPALYGTLFITVLASRKRRADPAAVRARKAFGRLTSGLDKAQSSGEVIEVFRSYLGDKLRLTSGALTFGDIKAPLEKRGAGPNVIGEVKAVFEICEAGRYAGGSTEQDTAGLVQRCREIARELEKCLRR